MGRLRRDGKNWNLCWDLNEMRENPQGHSSKQGLGKGTTETKDCEKASQKYYYVS